MPFHEKALLVPYSPEEMFDLVVDVERYPEFVPGYREVTIVRREPACLYTLQAVGLGAVQARFHSVAGLERPRRIRIHAEESPFDLLEIEWLFEPVPEGCRINFRADAHLAEGLTARLLQPWFERLAESIPPAFVARARKLYGQRVGPGPR